MITLGPVLADIRYSFPGTWRWLSDGAHWSGPQGITHRIFEHVTISVDAVLIAVVIGLPLGLLIGHTGKGAFLAVNTANIGVAVPSFAVLALGSQVLHIGFRPALLAMVFLAVPPIVTNTYTGIRAVDPDVVEAARGMGMAGRRLLFGVELPLAIPLVMAGVRTAGVQVVATATLAAVVGYGGLGRFVIDGLAQQDGGQLVGGCLLVILLALVTEVGLGALQRLLTPVGLRRERRYGARVHAVVPAGEQDVLRASTSA